MLSPGNYHLLVPKDRRRNLQFRLFILKRAAEDKQFRAGIREMCARDVLFWINAFVWQYNPRKKGSEIGQFLSWDLQEEAIADVLNCVETDEDLIAEKSREMGATWLFLLIMLWIFLFHPWKKFLCISRSEKAVEDEDPDSLFWKLDFVLRYLPDWLVPNIKRRKLYYGNEDNGSTITGQASTGKAGVGGRATAMFIDEFSQIEEDYEVLHRTSDTTGCRIFNGTHLGLDTAFYELTQRVDMRKLQMHWTQHPDKNKGLYRHDPQKNQVEIIDKAFHFPADYKFVMDGSPTGGPFPGIRSPWYDKECKRKGSSRAIAMDLDIDPKGSVSQFFDRITIRILQDLCCAPYWEGDLKYDKDSGRPIHLVARSGGPLKLWLTPSHDGLPVPAMYCFGADLAAGTGATPSCITGCKVATGEKVVEYVNPFIDPAELAPLAVALCWLFKSPDGQGALFAWEMQGPGLVFGNKVMELGYRNVYFKTDDFNNVQETSEKPGWYPAPNAKRLILEEYKDDLKNREFLNRSKPALEECLAFRYDKRGNVEHGTTSTEDPSGATLNHSDRVIADALCNKMRRSLGAPVKKRIEPTTPVMSLQWRRDYHRERERQEELA